LNAICAESLFDSLYHVTLCCDGFRTETKNRGFSQKPSDTETTVFGGRGFGFNQEKQISMYSNI